MILKNTKGKIFYGMHFYPGVAEYSEPDKEPYCVFLNEDTIRSMDASFAGRPIFVDHVDEVEEDVDVLRNQADGWVVESFYNPADGKHWAKFIVVSERAERAIESGYRLSNAYVPNSFGPGGVWNGVTFAKQVISAEYEHLAIVNNPRYDESKIMTPEQFKQYNNDQQIELKRIANSKGKGESKMDFKFFKRTKVENSADISGVMVELPKSKKQLLVSDVLTKYDAILNMNGYANGDHMVKVGEDEMSVNDLVKKHMEMCNAEAERAAKEETDNAGEGEPGMDIENDEDEASTVEEGGKDVGSRGGDEHLENEDVAEEPDHGEEKADEKKVAAKKEGVKKNELERERAKKIAANKVKNAALKNAHLRDADEPAAMVDLGSDKIARGIARYGSN